MNSDRDHLLDDILAEPGDSGKRRAALLNRTLRQVKRRRTVRRARWAGAVLVLPALALLLWRVHLPHVPTAANREVHYVLVRTEPTPRSALLATHPLATSELVVSAPSPNLATIATRPEARGYREIDDTTLLALAGTNAAVLVRLGPHSAQLVFAAGTTKE